MQRLCPAEFLCSRAKMQQKKNDPCFYPWLIGFFWPRLTKDKNPLEACKNGSSQGGNFECVFFQNVFKISNRIFEASFFWGKDWPKKNTSVFSLEYFFFWLVRCSGKGSVAGNNFLANSKKATKSYSRN